MTPHARTPTSLDAAAFIDGKWVSGGDSFIIENPANGADIGRAANATVTDAVAAVDAAAGALAAWASTVPRQRAEVLGRVHALMCRDIDRLAGLITLENGKMLADARAEVLYAAEFFRWYAEEAVRATGSYGPAPGGGARTVVTHAPVGVAALVTPWNFPAAMPARKIAPALAAGCTVVLKPAAETPLTAAALVGLLAEAGVADGVVNLVPTLDAAAIVASWLDDPRVRKLSFTGSTPVGKALLRHASSRVLNCSMELGGAAPFIVGQKADLDAAVAGALVAKFRAGGQACTAANSFHVHASIADEFTARLGRVVASMNVGAAGSGPDVGPLISARAVKSLSQRVQRAVEAGARIVATAYVPTNNGFFFPPTVMADVAADSDLVTEEIFGPVAPISTWRDLDDLIVRLNRSEYGLAAYVFASDLGAGLRVAERLDVGMVAVNRGHLSDPAAPFGGTKQSGLGREGARHGLEEFTETKYVSLDWPEQSQ